MDQEELFSEFSPFSWKDEWKGMPEFVQEDLEPIRTMYVHFENEEDIAAFSKLINHKITPDTKSVWYPELEITPYMDKRYIDASGVAHNPQYPVYIISKGRWESRKTSKALERMNIPYHIVIEPQEYEDYAAVIDPKNILVLPFSNLGLGGIPARNWVWEHSISVGAKRHWILDDNINSFVRLNRNLKVWAESGTIFRAAEDFVDRYENVALSGFQYWMFAPRKAQIPAFYLNTRIYSCILIQNDIPYRWRGRYNEDTDLSIRALKDGWCTILFNAFLCDKQATMTMKGGNTDELYKNDGRLLMAQSLQEQHPDIVTITQKWGRPQHQVDYRPFKTNKLKLKEGITLSDEVNNYGMVLKKIEKEQ